MATQFDAVLTTEIGNLVGLLPVPLTLLGMQFTWLHVVLGSDAVELSLHQINLVVIAHITLVEGYTNHEVVLVSVFQFHSWIRILGGSPLCPKARGCHSQHEGKGGF